MNIVFDIFVLVEGLEDEMNAEDRAIFGQIIEYFEQRLELLREEMEREEAKGQPPCCIMIHFLPPEEEWSLPKEQQSQKIRISANGYPLPLRQKLEASFNDNDFIILNQKLEEIEVARK